MARKLWLRSLFLLCLSPLASFAAEDTSALRRPYTNHTHEILSACQNNMSPLARDITSLRQYRQTRVAQRKDTIVMFFRPSQCVAETNGDLLAFRERVKLAKIRFASGTALTTAANTCVDALGAAAALQERICGGVSSEVHLQVLATEDRSIFETEFKNCDALASCLFVESGQANGDIHQFHLADYAQRIVGNRPMQPVQIITADPGRPAPAPSPGPPQRRAGDQERAPAGRSPSRRGALFNFLGTITLPGH
jgi:hypothetical protein